MSGRNRESRIENRESRIENQGCLIPDSRFLIPFFCLGLLVASAHAGEMKDEVKVDATTPQALRKLFSTYGYQPPKSIFPEVGGFRFWLPANVSDVPQTGLYSYFKLAGDCEASFAYELLNLPAPQKGYGAGVALAFDAGDHVGRAALERIIKPGDGSGYVLQTGMAVHGGKGKEEYVFVKGTSKRGRIGLRRVKKELIFLAAESPSGPLEEIGRLAFTDHTIQTVRIYADPGGSPTAVDVRVRDVRVKADEITGGMPEIAPGTATRWWLWGGLGAIGAAFLFCLWWLRWRNTDDEDDAKPAKPTAKPAVKPAKAGG
jgi:hypothetical protein